MNHSKFTKTRKHWASGYKNNSVHLQVVELIHEKCCSEIQETVLASDLDKETISKFSNEQVSRPLDKVKLLS